MATYMDIKTYRSITEYIKHGFSAAIAFLDCCFRRQVWIRRRLVGGTRHQKLRVREFFTTRSFADAQRQEHTWSIARSHQVQTWRVRVHRDRSISKPPHGIPFRRRHSLHHACFFVARSRPHRGPYGARTRPVTGPDVKNHGF